MKVQWQIDPLHHLIAAHMFEIDIGVGRLAALLGDEALEQQIIAPGVDRGDAEYVADGGVRGRSPALTPDVAAKRDSVSRAASSLVRLHD